jgi:hypothetical protein
LASLFPKLRCREWGLGVCGKQRGARSNARLHGKMPFPILST